MTVPPRLASALADRYLIERELGAGGMATVYLAHDLKHDRKVALKVLKPELASVVGGDRFLAEIKTTANLQHPHILALFDSGQVDGTVFYAMPYVEGESLRDRLAREKQLPIDDALRITLEVADALQYAHEHGVIHRDIKPENILLHGGHAMVADFGIALAVSKTSGSRMTETGMSLGTPTYMSPEQAMGERELDARADVYALGCVVYEMLVGDPPHGGSSAQAIVAKVITEKPVAIIARRDRVPAYVEHAVLTALEKLPADRFGSAAAFAAALTNPAFTAARSVAPAHRRAPVVLWLLLSAAVAFIVIDRLRPKAMPPAVERLSIRLPENTSWVAEDGSGMALSPDGTMLAYTGRDSTAQRRVYLRRLDQLEPIPVAGAEYGSHPIFSPDGRWLAFEAMGIQKVLVAGGVPESLCKTPGYVNATWLESNDIVFADGTDLGLKRCSLRGEVTTLLPSDSGESFNFPHGLPGDRGVLLSIRRGPVERLAVFDLRTRTRKSLDIVGTDPRYVDTGHLVYTDANGLIRAVTFDLKTLATRGESVIIAEGVQLDRGRALMALSRTGTMVAAGEATSERALELVDRSGRGERLYPRPGNFLEPRFSPDGRRIAVGLAGEIWLFDRPQGALTRLSHDSLAARPVWTPNGRQVAYERQTGAKVVLRIMNADGSAPAEPLLAWPDLSLWETLFTPNGESMVVRTTGGPLRREMWLVALDSAHTTVPLLSSPAEEVAPAISPDGRWLAYASNESGRYEIYVRPFPGMGARYPVSLDGGTEPVWSRRGNELFYRSGPKLFAAEVRLGVAFDVLRRTLLFSNGDYAADPTHQGYDVAPDGAHFVMVRRLEGTSFLNVTLHRFQNVLDASPAPSPSGRER